MGERWIDTKLYADFATELFETETSVMYFDVNDTYIVRLQSYSPVAYNTYFVRNYDGGDLFVHALHDTVPEITKEIYRNGDKVRVPDEEAIQEAATKIQEIRDRFNCWLDRQPIEVRDELVRVYNERFNCYVRPHYDGSAQTFPQLSFEQFPYDSLESVLFFKLEIFSHNIAINKQINTSIIEMQIYWQRSFYILSIVCKA